MKKVIMLCLLLVGMFATATAQKYHVYDGDTFSIMFKCNTANTQVLDVKFSSKDKTTGEWKWNKFQIDDYHDFEDTSVGGFIFDVTDNVGNKYAVDYYRDTDHVIVHAINSNGEYGSQWDLPLRK